MSDCCPICINTYTTSTRLKVQCPYCELAPCVQCFKKYLLSSTDGPHCMGCHKGYTLNFITEYTPLTFHNKEYRDHRASILLSREKSLLPATQQKAAEYAKQEADKKAIQEFNREIMALRKKIKGLVRKRDMVQYQHRHAQPKKIVFTVPCPVDSCRGFLTEDWKCGLCNKSICKYCRLEIRENHTCDKETVESIKLINTETRPCPKCGAPIYKIDGCDQIWCTVEACHTAFNWHTGKIETKVHNPHYYEYMRARGGMPRAVGDERPCDEFPGEHKLFSRFNQTNLITIDDIDVFSIHRQALHIQLVVRAEFRSLNSERQLEDLRIKFLIGEIDEETWSQRIKKISKQKEFNTEIGQVLEMFVSTIKDILRNLLISMDQAEAIKMAQEVREYMNTHIEKIKYCFKMSAPTWDRYFVEVRD